jgi:hypothetical protein
MFKGITDQIKKESEKLNSQDSNYFAFFFSDLELVEENSKRKKCRLLSNELSNKLHQIFSESKSGYTPPIKFIDFELDEDDNFLFPSRYTFSFWNYDKWLKLYKKDIKEKSKVSPDGTLKFNFVVEHDLPDSENYEADRKERTEFARTEAEKSNSARTSALSQIQNTIQNGNIDFTTLKDATFFLEESYVSAWPSDCLYCSTLEELAPGRETDYYQTHINKCLWRPDRINDFKDGQIYLLQRIINKFNDYKNQVIKEIIKSAKDQGITEEQLKTTRPDWQNHLRSLKNRNEIQNYQKEYLDEDIKNLFSAKNQANETEKKRKEQEVQENAKQEQERLKKAQQEKEKREKEEQAQKAAEQQTQQEQEAKKRELENQKTNSITKIITSLNQEPQLNNSDLSSEYQNWENKLNGLTELEQITDWESKVLVEIQARKKDKKTEQEVKENLNQFQNPEATPQQKEEALNNLQRNEGEKSYEEQKENINQVKTEQATQNPTKYSQNAVNKITKKMQEEGISDKDLKDNQTKTLLTNLKNGEIKDPTKIVAAENQIRQEVWQTKVQKEIQTLTSEVNQVLQSSKVKKQDITKIKQKLIEFLAKSNVYYSTQHQKSQALLTKLENYQNANQQRSNNPASSPSALPWKIIIPLFLMVIILLSVGTIAWRAKRIGSRKKTKN